MLCEHKRHNTNPKLVMGSICNVYNFYRCMSNLEHGPSSDQSVPRGG